MFRFWKQKCLILLCTTIGMIMGTENTCNICFELFGDDVEMTNCGHKFCGPCLKQWKEKNGTCPECRNNLNSINPLITRIKENDITGATFILKRNQNTVNLTNENDEKPLTTAAKKGNQDIVILLLLNGADLNVLDEHGENPMNIALKNDNELIALKLFEKIPNFDDSKMLCVACKLGYLPVVQLYIENFKNGGNSLDNEHEGWSGLACAIKYEQLQVTELLWEADPENMQENKNKALVYAVISKTIKMVDFAIVKGADVNFKINFPKLDGETELTPLQCAAATGNIDIGEILLKHESIMVNERNSFGQSALSFAIGTNDIKFVQLLLKYEADIMWKDEEGRTLLYDAIATDIEDRPSLYKANPTDKCTTEMVDTLLKYNSASMYFDHNRNNFKNALYTAAIVKNEPVVSHILQYFSNLVDVDIIKKVILSVECLIQFPLPFDKTYASEKALERIRDLLMKFENQSLICTIYKNNAEGVKNILKQNPDSINERMRDNMTPLIMASKKGFEEIVSILLDKKLNVNIKEQTTKEHRTALMYASYRGDVQIVKRLMKLDPTTFNQTDKDGRNALYFSVKFQRMNILNFFLNNKSELIGHKMLVEARKYAPTDEIKNKLNNCKSIFESIEENNEKSARRIKHILLKNPDAAKEKNEMDQTPSEFSEQHNYENMKNQILEILPKNDEEESEEKIYNKKKLLK